MPMSLPLLHTLYSCSYYHLSQSSSRPSIIPALLHQPTKRWSCHIKYALLNISAYLSKSSGCLSMVRYSNAEPVDSALAHVKRIDRVIIPAYALLE